MKLVKWIGKKLQRIFPYTATSLTVCGVVGIIIYFN